jgi:DNA-binding XRE family transcriptional regulator
METSLLKTATDILKGGLSILDQKTTIPRENRTLLPRFYLIEQRLKLGMSVEEVSRLLNVSRYYYYQLESGRRGIKLSMPMSLSIIKALEMDALKFLQLEAEHAEKYRNLNRT